MSKFICIHIGARAHYLIPKSLEANDKLSGMITDTWISSGFIRTVLRNLPSRIIKSFSNRYSGDLPSEKVFSFNIRFFFIELYIRFKHKEYWNQILARNDFFQQLSLPIFDGYFGDSAVVATSYTALKIFRRAKQREQKTILFQIDPAFIEEEIVADIVSRYEDKYLTNWTRAPLIYWSNWREECFLSDIIMVNSDWSKRALIESGIIENKIKVLPLPFQLQNKHLTFKRAYPDLFSTQRPLRCLFLGTLSLRKGIHLVIEAAEKVKNHPIQFILVGKSEVNKSLLTVSNIVYKGLVTREETDTFYREADIFLFTTLSDGFGLTQLEAMAWKMPVISSNYCGKVVTNEFNGILLNDCSSQSLAEVLVNLSKDPIQISNLSSKCLDTVRQFSKERFAESLSKLI